MPLQSALKDTKNLSADIALCRYKIPLASLSVLSFKDLIYSTSKSALCQRISLRRLDKIRFNRVALFVMEAAAAVYGICAYVLYIFGENR